MNIRKLDWFYVENIPDKGLVNLSSDESRHLKVKRHKEGDKICVFNGKGKIGICKVIKNGIEIESIKEFPKDDFLTIATAVPKGERMDFLLQKLTELNVSRIIPLKTKYSIVEPKETKQKRWERIIMEASKQSKRAWLPEIKNLTNFSDVLKEKADVKILLSHGEKPLNLPKSAKNVIVIIGPEGGLADEEINQAEKAGFVKASIGDLTLRIETAAMAAAAIIGNKPF